VKVVPSEAEAGVAAETAGVHTPTVTLKNAALLALIATILMTALWLWSLVLTFLNVPAKRPCFPPTLSCSVFVTLENMHVGVDMLNRESHN
jgi:hypothetical protein